MADSLMTRFKSAWDVFRGREDELPPTTATYSSYGGYPEHRSKTFVSRVVADRTIITSIYTRLAVDVASYDLRHIRTDDDGRYESEMQTFFNECLSVAANLDQTGRAFLLDAAYSLLSKGSIAIVPVETTSNPIFGQSYDIKQLRVGEVKEWVADRVVVSVYNERSGQREDVTLLKRYVAIVENPFYAIMNEPNSTLQRLTSKLSLLDSIDAKTASSKLDIIIQLPYTIRTESRRAEATKRVKEIEFQLQSSSYGIAYADGSERITQLNRPAENNLLPQITYLKDNLYNELGLTKAILDGTADEAAMLNYFSRTIVPIVKAIVESMDRTFISKTARTQKQAIMFHRNPFEFVPVSQLAEIGDKMTRNEIMSANDLRVIMGLKPSKDPNADKLRNSNMPQPKEDGAEPPSQKKEVAPALDNPLAERLRGLGLSNIKTPLERGNQ